jgi:hypothetical protein
MPAFQPKLLNTEDIIPDPVSRKALHDMGLLGTDIILSNAGDTGIHAGHEMPSASEFDAEYRVLNDRLDITLKGLAATALK